MDDSESMSQFNTNALLAKSSQMTPPKSVESTSLSGFSAVSSSLHQHHSSGVNSSVTASAAGTMPPASYDDLNNIFEEESSDEMQPAQQQQQPAIQSQQVIQPPAHQSSFQFNNQTNNNVSTMSVVMTPPSHETKYDEQMNLLTGGNQLPNGNQFSSSVNVHDTKTLVLNDYASLVYDKLATKSLLDEFTVPKMNLANIKNRYKIDAKSSVTVNSNSNKKNSLQVAKFKWSLSVNTTFNSTIHSKINPNQRILPQNIKQEKSSTIKSMTTLMKPTGTANSLGNHLYKGSTKPSSIRLKPLDKFLSQLDQAKIVKSNLNVFNSDAKSALTFINSVCLSVSLSDTLMNAQRDINFDTCTLCVCSNNNIKGGSDFSVLIANDIYENKLNDTQSAHHANSGGVPSSSQQQQISNDSHSMCTCGFSSLINRSAVNRTASCIQLGKYLEMINARSSDPAASLPYFNLINLLNNLTSKDLRDNQLLILDSNSCNGLFVEDYVEILGITLPHHFISSLLQQTAKLNSSLITRKFLNSVLLKDTCVAKKPLVKAISGASGSTVTTPAVTTSTTPKSKAKTKVEPESLNSSLTTSKNEPVCDDLTAQSGSNILDTFDLTYSNPFLTVYDTFDIFYDNEAENRELVMPPNGSQTLNQHDENNVCRNMINNLLKSDDKATSVDTGNFLLDKWLYKKKPIKSNLELTKSLKLIQPILEETVQKKYTTSRMWESFQGPLTWQHFCRLAFIRENSGSSASASSASSKSGTSMSGGSSSAGGASGSQNQNQNQNAANYEPEPIPALLVSSSDKDWQTVAPYAVKFWDKLGLEPYSKYKNVAYLVMMPDLEGNINSSTGAYEDTMLSSSNAENSIQQAVKEYFRELSSAYELCRLGVHRPALRIAPDNGLVRVPLYTQKNSSQFYSNVKVDPWFDKIQLNKSSRYIGN
jgi:hypothetical protein